ncbi:C45 family autoproteolytic acyltransferase/hydolase [Paraclostridium ghonii]|uniref:Choloylglycine hydrolase n=1 Tax=Paraclostridium ghonii TaxID=29358 RepID=A0ABU0N643_9FIRM|nr:C45 family peptidase [Paeniclostridium ghonii]MDQ0558171.1 putative choloylglycine hydrolase [Paeniclostridium ghonii]
MYHSRWNGSHYEAGLRYGNRLYKNGVNPMDNIPISNERKDFAINCLPIYEKFYPEIVEEIKGIADGLKIGDMDIANFLFTMYSFIFSNKCSCLPISDKEKTFFARNSDFIVSIEKLCDSAYYKLDNVYSFIGNTTAWTEMEDGVNEHGLAVGLTFIYPKKIKPGFNAGMLVRYILEKCKTTDEAILALKNIPISSPQTITLADKKGDIAVVECNCDKVVVLTPQIGENYIFTTNHFVSDEMKEYQVEGIDDAYSYERYKTLVNSLINNEDYSLDFIKNLLSGKMGFMCQYDRKKGIDTVWSSIYDLKCGEIFRAEGNPSRRSFKKDERLILYSKNN